MSLRFITSLRGHRRPVPGRAHLRMVTDGSSSASTSGCIFIRYLLSYNVHDLKYTIFNCAVQLV